jgi:hypothetical protein
LEYIALGYEISGVHPLSVFELTNQRVRPEQGRLGLKLDSRAENSRFLPWDSTTRQALTVFIMEPQLLP